MKKIFISVLIGLFVVMALLPQMTRAQFGKNKINYDHFKWCVYEHERAKIYFYPEEEHVLPDMIRWVNIAYNTISSKLNAELPKKNNPHILFFLTHSDFEQQNVYLGYIPPSATAFAEDQHFRVCIPIDQAPEDMEHLVTHELTHIFQYQIWHGGRRKVTTQTRREISWLYEGLAEFVSRGFGVADNHFVRNLVINNRIPPIELWDRFTDQYTIRYVIAEKLFQYLYEKAGEAKFIRMVAEFKKAGPTIKGFEKVLNNALGMDFNQLNLEFRKWLRKKYIPLLNSKKEANDYGPNLIAQSNLLNINRGKPLLAAEIAVSPSGQLGAVLTVYKDDLDIVIVGLKDGTILKNLTKGRSFYKYGEYIEINLFDYNRSITWSPDGDYVLFFARTGEKRSLFLVSVTTGKVYKKIKMKLDNASSPEMSADGKTIVFSALENNQSDIFSLNLDDKSITNLTQDKNFDYGPTLAPNDKNLVYISSINGKKKLVEMDLENKEKRQLTFGDSEEYKPIFDKDGKQIFFISDCGSNRILNIYSLDIETGKIFQWTDLIDGALAVAPGKDKKIFFNALAYVNYFQPMSWTLHEMELKNPENDNVIALKTEIQNPKEEKPKTSEIKVDPEKIKKYNAWKNILFENGMFYGEIGTRGIYGYGYFSLADRLGNHRVQATIIQFGKWYKYNTLAYFNLSRRINWGITISDENHRFYPWYADQWYSPSRLALDEVLYQLRLKRTRLNAVAQYPFDKFHRFELSLAGTSVKYQCPNWQSWVDYYASLIETAPLPDDPIWQLYPEGYRELYLAYLATKKEVYELRRDFIDKYINGGKFGTVTIGFVRDTALYKQYGEPFTNDMYGIYLSWSTGGHNALAVFEGRKYFRLSPEWALAFRGYAGAQFGKTINPRTIGDLGELRGYEWMQFMGNRIWMINSELRFPLVKDFNLFGFLYLGDIRAALFCDLAKIWFDDAKFNALNEDEINPGLIKGSTGIDLTLGTFPILGVPVHLTFSKRMTEVKLLPKFEKDWQIKLYLGYSF